MNIVILGSGNVATHLALSLNRAGEDIVQVYSRNLEHATQVALGVNARAIDNLDEVDVSADIYFIAVKDDAILEVLQSIKSVRGLVVHTSGSTSIDVLSHHLKDFGVFYPLQTFSKDRQVDFKQVPICIEANKESNLIVLENLATKLSKSVYRINSEERKALHIAAVFAGNFSNHMYTLAGDILKDRDLNFDLLKPLITETAAKVMDNLPNAVQTGPAIRNDETTILSHLSWLKKTPDLQTVYKIISESIKIKHK